MVNLVRRILSRKALSPVVATLMMVSIVFAMFAILYPWATSSLMLYQAQANIWYGNQEKLAQERIAIEMVLFNKTTNKTDVYVRNVGEIEVNIRALYVNSTDFSASTYINSTTKLSDLPKGYTVYVKTSTLKNITKFSVVIGSSPSFYSIANIRVVTSRGSEADSMVQK